VSGGIQNLWDIVRDEDRNGNVLKLLSDAAINSSGDPNYNSRGGGGVLGRQQNVSPQIAVDEVVVVQGWAKKKAGSPAGGEPYFVIGTEQLDSARPNTRFAKIHPEQDNGEWYPFQISYRNGVAGQLFVWMGIYASTGTGAVANNAAVADTVHGAVYGTSGIEVYFDDIYVYRNQ